MRKSSLLTLTLALALGGALTLQAEDFRWEGKLAKGKTLEVKGINGGIEATGTSGDRVVVTAVKRGKRSQPKEVKIEVVEHGGGVTVCAVYPSPSSKPNECVPGGGGRMGTKNNDVKVEFTVKVPDGVSFVGRTVNGGIEATSLSANAEAHTVNGSIKLATSGYGTAETVNGSIKASLGSADWTGDLEFETVNGGITVELPEGTGARVSARTVNGGIETDFPLTIMGKFGSKRISGTIGGGGRDLLLETVNGRIHLKKAS